MSIFQRIAFHLSIVSWIGMLAPTGYHARAAAETPIFHVVDAALDPSGSLAGTLLDEHHRPLTEIPIALSESGKYLATSMTDQQGRFSFANLRGGTYLISTGNAVQMVRVWKHGTAPPSSVSTLTLVTSAEVVRGQGPFGIGLVPMACLGMSATALALSIILPITLSNDDDEAS